MPTPHRRSIDASPPACFPRPVHWGGWARIVAIGCLGLAGLQGFGAEPAPGAPAPVPVSPLGTGSTGFTRMDPEATGITVTNRLTGDQYLTHAVAHNGAGVALGDVDGDGRPDVYFCSLEGGNALHRNLGGWRFEPMDAGEAACPGQLSTAATLADLDGDRDLDLLVNGVAAGTRLFLNDGRGRWTEVRESGLSRTASATSMALADLDGDGDLDLYCTHYSDFIHLADPTLRFAVARKGDRWMVTKVNGESAQSPRWKDRFEALPDGRVRELPEVHGLYLNDGTGRFTAMEHAPGTFLDEEGRPVPPHRDWGLAAMFRDINRDGLPDLYVCNDNTSPDRIWINQGRGVLRAVAPGTFRHTSRSSMGVDFGDLDRDGRDDLMVVDMLARDPARRVTQLVRDRPTPQESAHSGSRPQYNRNTLFFGRADGSFAEGALMAGVAATDWSWTVAFLDVDLDGFEDLLVTNGFEFDVMDQDSHARIQEVRRQLSEAELKRSRQMHPRWRTRNAAFRNQGDRHFEPVAAPWRFDHPGVSYGMAQADLDGDGDLDLVVNNLNEAAAVYRNDGAGARIAVQLRGLAPNTQGIGARIELRGGRMTQSQEMISGGRYLSSDQPLRVFAADPDPSVPMTLSVRWRSGRRTEIRGVQANHRYEVVEGVEPVPPPSPVVPPPSPVFQDLTDRLRHLHTEGAGQAGPLQPLLPEPCERPGPGVAWRDLDGDGWEDLVIGSGPGARLGVFRNEQGRSWSPLEGISIATGDPIALVGAADGTGRRRLLMASEGTATGSGILVLDTGKPGTPVTLPLQQSTPGPLALGDLDGDGDLDLFVGGRSAPGRYPEPADSTVWINDRGTWSQSAPWSDALRGLGNVNGATLADLDQDGRMDLALTLDWGPIRVFHNTGDHFEDRTESSGLATLTGLWTGITAGDFDGDGRLDLACGNQGRNTLLELFQPTPFRLYHGDWNGDGVVEMLEAWRSSPTGDWFPVHNRPWLEGGMPGLSGQFPTHAAFGKATVKELLGRAHEGTPYLEAVQLASVVLLNRGSRWESRVLPGEAQISPVYSMVCGDLDGDGSEDLFLSQNRWGAASDLTRHDAGLGLWLRGTGQGGFEPVDALASGIQIPGEQRGAALADFNHDGRLDLAVAQNRGATRLFANVGGRPGLRVHLVGPPGNPDAIGAQVRLGYPDGRRGPVHAIQAGSGWRSQDAPVPVLGFQEPPTTLEVRWPGGREQVVPVEPPGTSVRVPFPE